MTSITDEIVPKLRRAIGDTDTDNQTYQDTALAEYIEDATDKLRIKWQHGYEVDRQNHQIEPDVEQHHQLLIVMQSKLDMLDRKNNISFQTGTLSVTRKDDAQKRLSEKLDEFINSIKIQNGVIVGTDEYDAFSNRIKDWIYVTTLE